MSLHLTGLLTREPVLLAEKDRETLSQVSQPFQANGFRLVVARSQSELRKEIHMPSSFGLAIIDVDCAAGLEHLLLSRIGPRRLIFTSASSAPEVQRRFRCVCFQKPLSPVELYHAALARLHADAANLARAASRVASSRLIADMHSSDLDAIRSLAYALELCSRCDRRCPGITTCQRIAAILHGSGKPVPRD